MNEILTYVDGLTANATISIDMVVNPDLNGMPNNPVCIDLELDDLLDLDPIEYDSCDCDAADYADVDGDGDLDSMCCPEGYTTDDTNGDGINECLHPCETDGLCSQQCNEKHCSDGTMCSTSAQCQHLL